MTLFSARNRIKSASMFIVSCFLYLFTLSCSDPTVDAPIITAASDSAKIYYEKGTESFLRLKNHEASYYFLKAISFDPDFSMANFQMAHLQDDIRISMKYLNRAKKGMDNLSHPEKLQILAFEANLDGDQKKQHACLKELHDEYPTIPAYINPLANFYFSVGDEHKAIPIYLRAIELDSSYHQSYNQLGYAYRNTGDLKNAKKYLKKYMEILPDEVNPLDSYAELLVKTGDFENGLIYYRKALEVDPLFMSANIGVGTSLTYLGRGKEAREQLLKYLDNAPNNIIRRIIYFSVAASYLYDENLPDAIRHLDRAHFISDVTENLGNQVSDLYSRSLIFFENGKPDSAKGSLKLLIQSIDDYGATGNQSIDSVFFCYKMLTGGYIHYLDGNLTDANKIGEAYLSKLAIRNSQGRKLPGNTLLGLVALLSGDLNKAFDHFNKTYSTRAMDKYYRGVISDKLGNREMALKEFRDIIDDNPILNLNSALYYKKAIKQLRRLETASVST